jgi:hypothetical protein
MNNRKKEKAKALEMLRTANLSYLAECYSLKKLQWAVAGLKVLWRHIIFFSSAANK